MVKAELLPARAAYLIYDGSKAGFRRAVQEASTRWGGMAEPIIPVRPDGEVEKWWRKVIETAGVEGLVNVDVPANLVQKLSESCGLPVAEIDDIDRSGPTRFTVHPIALSSYRDHSSQQTPVVACVDGSLWQVVLAGDFTADHAEEHKDVLSFRRPTTADQVARAALAGQTFLDRTVDQFRENYAEDSWPSPAILWVAGDEDFQDCLLFWNLRALRPSFGQCPMVIIPADEVESWTGFSREWASQLARPDEFAPDVVVISRSVPEVALHQLATKVFGLKLTDEEVRTGFRVPADLRVPPFTYRVNLDVRHFFIFSRRYGEVRQTETFLTDGRAQLRFPSPVEFSGGGKLLLRLSSTLLDALPARDVLAARIANAAVWRGRSVQIATHNTNVYQVDLSIPSQSEATAALVGDRVSTWSMSEKGRLAAALMEDAGPAVLLQPSVYEAIRHLTTPRATAYRREMERMRASGLSGEEIDEFGARWGGRGERRYDSASAFIARVGHQMSDPVGALEKLCSIGWAERGFEVDCDRCGIRSFVPLAAVETVARCPGCRAASRYTTSVDSVTLYYRLNTLIDRASDQGVVPHLLVIAELTKRDANTNLLGGVLATFGDVTREIDVVGIHDQQFIAGEVKSKAKDFTSTQLDRDFDTSARLGVDAHILASVDGIPAEIERAAIDRASVYGLKVIALSGKDLRPEGTPDSANP
ncbi:hypothetical protein AVL48_14645 [Amycolatopsis regifaucium]|uniref:Uncharacterized protein n=2 Tax=Amycolatopsis regifaucium TaxID=546365 RepID=A0A154M719_9PSEU|nr:hypothetical protein AVL48_14645 [Amycolatopsis regifaucium]OKA10035.1 hypothetical protein ATP06_0206770 [Amycolatopsis regifaucium]